MVGPQGWLVKFGQYMKTQGFSERSIPDYLRNVRLFLDYLKELDVFNLADVDRKLILDYQLRVSVEQHDGHSLAHITQRNRLTCLKTFFRYLVRNAAVIYDPIADIELPRIRDQIPASVLSRKEIALLLSQPDLEKVNGVRDRAMLELLYSTGIRVSELASLDLEDIDLRNGELRVKGKGDKERLVPLGEVVRDYLELYLQESRPQIAPSELRAFFVTYRGKRFYYTNVCYLVRQYGKKAGISKRVTPHGLRHTCATHLLKGKADIRQIQKILGHASIATTQRYTRVEISDLKKVIKRCHPRERRQIKVYDL